MSPGDGHQTPLLDDAEVAALIDVMRAVGGGTAFSGVESVERLHLVSAQAEDRGGGVGFRRRDLA